MPVASRFRAFFIFYKNTKRTLLLLEDRKNFSFSQMAEISMF